MQLRHLITLAALFLWAGIFVKADNETPSISPTVTFTDSLGNKVKTNHHTGSAPLEASFEANPANDSGWQSYYEWRFSMEAQDTPYLLRYEQDTEYTFTTAGAHNIVLYAVFTRGDEKVEYDGDKLRFWKGSDYTEEPSGIETITVSISESKLEMPNAFSPNGDDKNEIYRAKPGYQSIVSFRGIIFNRWGQKLFEWSDINDGWDGTYKGSPVKEGVYFVLVEAKGADGRTFTIKRDVNLLRGFTEGASSTSGGEQ
ncbi:MAG: gliding motility-associated C-terminal domain-containing protein [Prevotella sp.]|nr:gliding motility-associated C-terminal domain-containing protein [Prevotella sp.]